MGMRTPELLKELDQIPDEAYRSQLAELVSSEQSDAIVVWRIRLLARRMRRTRWWWDYDRETILRIIDMVQGNKPRARTYHTWIRPRGWQPESNVRPSHQPQLNVRDDLRAFLAYLRDTHVRPQARG